MGLLSGIKVVDFTLAHAGSLAAMLLADYGAEVIKIERTKTGELARTWAPYDSKGNSGYFAYLNRGKRDVSIDARSPEGKEVVKKLIKEADVITENFKLGSMDRLGLSYEEVKKINPKIIYASLNGMGQTGPRKDVIGLDLHLQSMSGLSSMTGYADKSPTRVGSALSDHISGAYMATAIIFALINAEKTGQGQRIDIGILDSVFSMLEGAPISNTLKGVVPGRTGNSYPSISPYDTFETKDGRVSVGVCTDRQWGLFCKALGMEELIDDPRYATNETRGDNYNSGLRDFIEAKTKQLGREEFEGLMMDAKIPCSVVRKVSEAMESPQVEAREMMITVDDPAIGQIKMPGLPIKLKNNPASVWRGAPLLGQDTLHYMESLGYSEGEIRELEEKNIIEIAKVEIAK